MKIHLRSSLKTDHEFIINAWVNNYQRNSYFAMRIPKDIFMQNHSEIIKNILNNDQTKVIIAGEGDQFTITGFLVYNENPLTIHYAYVRESMRGLGILKAILSTIKETSAQLTHWNQYTQDMYFKHKNIIYNPYPFYDKITRN